MNILGIDTTTKKAQVVIKKDNEIYTSEIDNEITHSEKLMPLIDTVLNESKLSLKDIDTLSCVQGPGSFTGVRIGIATIKAISKVINKPIVGITSLELLALDLLNKKECNYILSLMDARNDRVYFELFKIQNNKLTSCNYSGNEMLKNVINNLNKYNENNIDIVVDCPSIKEKIDTKNYAIYEGMINLENIFSKYASLISYSYLTLDAKYYRKSEAERTKDGE